MTPPQLAARPLTASHTIARPVPARRPPVGEHPVPAEVRRPRPARPTSRALRRRRLAAAVVVALAVFVGGLVAGHALDQRAAAATVSVPVVEPATATHIVQPGETLWSIARELQPSGDVRGLVDQLADRNGGATLRVGDRIEVPAS